MRSTTAIVVTMSCSLESPKSHHDRAIAVKSTAFVRKNYNVTTTAVAI